VSTPEVDVRAQDGAHVVRFTGDIDVATAPALQRAVLGATAGARHVVLDLSDVAWLDSTGLRLLDDVARHHHGRDATVRVLAPPDVPARYTLDLSAWRPDLVVGRMSEALAA
jgi:anti-anti-sigma factor